MLSSKGMKYVKGLRQEVASMSVPQLCKVDNSRNKIYHSSMKSCRSSILTAWESAQDIFHAYILDSL